MDPLCFDSDGVPDDVITLDYGAFKSLICSMFRILLLTLLASLTDLSSTAEEKLKITHLTDSFFVYTTYKDLGGTLFPSNSMYLVTEAGIVMFDTPWDSTQLQPLLDTIRQRHHKPIRLVISTHYHDDRTEGVSLLQQQGISTMATFRTIDLARKEGNDIPAIGYNADTTITVGGYRFELHYPGRGHTEDNIVAWFPDQKLLYGGCFIKSTESKNLGNLADADPQAWLESVKRLQQKYPEPSFVVPGHYGWKDRNSLSHTRKLLEEYLDAEK